MISTLDLIIVAAYIVVVFIVAAVYSFGQGLESFLVNKRATKLPFLVASIVSTNVGAGFFLSVAAEAYTTGISFGVSMIMVSTATALVFAAISSRGKKLADEGNIHTVPELLTKRSKSQRTGLVAAIITIGGYLFVTALQFVGIGAISSVISGLDLSTILLVSGAFTVAYSALGGIRSDLFADSLSFIIMIIALAVVVPAVAITDRVDLSLLPASKFDLFAFAGPPFFILSIILAAVSAFMFMELWQRVFAAESPKTARRAFLLSAVIQPLFIGTGIYLGLSASILYKDIDKSTAIFKLMTDYLPSGLLGLGLVAILSILMTTVNSLVVVGGSTLFTDIIKPRLKNDDEQSHLFWVRLLTVIFGTCALALAYVLPDLVKLFLMGAFVMMPLCPSIMWALFARKLHSGAAITSMIAGVAVTFALLPIMPATAFGPGFLVSLMILVIHSYYRKIHTPKSEEDNG